MQKATVPWVRKAEADYDAAHRLGVDAACHDAVCFHCQQCVEKYLKAHLVEANLNAPKTHDLDRLLGLVLPIHGTLRTFRRGLLFLSAFAVETRYPGFDASQRQATAALRWTEQIRRESRALLGIKPPRPRKRT